MYIPSGEWVIISGVKKYIKIGRLKSLRFRIIVLIILAGMVPGLIMRAVILSGYEDYAVQMRTAEIQNQCTILCDRLSNVDYSSGVASEVIQTELTQMTNIYNGRVMIINGDYQIVEDTYDMDEGKTIISEQIYRDYISDSGRIFRRSDRSYADKRFYRCDRGSAGSSGGTDMGGLGGYGIGGSAACGRSRLFDGSAV